jgi:hypothetical protein
MLCPLLDGPLQMMPELPGCERALVSGSVGYIGASVFYRSIDTRKQLSVIQETVVLGTVTLKASL